jgi:hypothetical protein
MTQPSNKRHQLLSAVTANTTGEKIEWSGVGPGTLHIYGTFDTCNVAIQGSTDGGTTWTAYSTSYTAATITSFEAGNILVRAVVTSVGGSTSVSADLVEQERSS